jgi:hypothetical protein
MARRPAFDHNGARHADAAGDGHMVHVAALAHAQNHPSDLIDRSFHKRGYNLDLLFEVVGKTLRREDGLFDSRRIAPDAPPAVFRIPNVAHVRTCNFCCCYAIISLLPHCSKEIVRCTHD